MGIGNEERKIFSLRVRRRTSVGDCAATILDIVNFGCRVRGPSYVYTAAVCTSRFLLFAFCAASSAYPLASVYTATTSSSSS